MLRKATIVLHRRGRATQRRVAVEPVLEINRHRSVIALGLRGTGRRFHHIFGEHYIERLTCFVLRRIARFRELLIPGLVIPAPRNAAIPLLVFRNCSGHCLSSLSVFTNWYSASAKASR